jgi:DeoR/GlpR family transcriptional regulator of sugar metabolism
MKRKMIAHSRETIMVADSSKFGKSCASRFARFEEVDRIVTDLGVDQGIIAEMEKVGVEVVLA